MFYRRRNPFLVTLYVFLDTALYTNPLSHIVIHRLSTYRRVHMFVHSH